MFDEKRIKEAKEFLETLKSTGQKRNIYNNVFNFLKEDILKLKEKGLTVNAIAIILSKRLNTEIKANTLNTWFHRNF